MTKRTFADLYGVSGSLYCAPSVFSRLSRHSKRTLAFAFALSAVAGIATAQTQPSGVAQGTNLRAVYEQAREYDAEYQAAQFELQAARQNIPIARSAFMPQLSFGADLGLASKADDGDGPYEETGLSLALNQTIFNRSSGKLIDQAQIGVQQAEAQYAAAGQTLILRVATAYFDVLRAQANVEFSQSELQAISRQREQAERRFDVGLVPITDVRSAQAQYDLAVAQEIAASNQLSTAREALLRVSGVNADLLTPLASDLPLTPPDPANIDAWVERAKEQNLELVIAQLANESSGTQVAIERAGRYPTLDLVGSAASTTTEEVIGRDGELASIRLQLRVPILTGGRINSQVAQAKAQARASEQQLLAQERTTTQQTRDAYRGVQASISRVRALRQALVSTQQSAEATDAGFRAGTRTSVDVLQALRDTFRAQSDYAGARYDYIINTLNLKAASGTLEENDLFAINRFLAIADDS
ncbi:MAG: TolC family outer membrane protein [Granulosicoccus sp.]